MNQRFTRQNGGGMVFSGGGVISRFEPVADKNSGEVKYYGCNVQYMGGEQFIKVDNDVQARFGAQLKAGAFVTFEADVASFKDSLYPRNLRILTIDGKPVAREGAAA